MKIIINLIIYIMIEDNRITGFTTLTIIGSQCLASRVINIGDLGSLFSRNGSVVNGFFTIWIVLSYHLATGNVLVSSITTNYRCLNSIVSLGSRRPAMISYLLASYLVNHNFMSKGNMTSLILWCLLTSSNIVHNQRSSSGQALGIRIGWILWAIWVFINWLTRLAWMLWINRLVSVLQGNNKVLINILIIVKAWSLTVWVIAISNQVISLIQVALQVIMRSIWNYCVSIPILINNLKSLVRCLINISNLGTLIKALICNLLKDIIVAKVNINCWNFGNIWDVA